MADYIIRRTPVFVRITISCSHMIQLSDALEVHQSIPILTLVRVLSNSDCA